MLVIRNWAKHFENHRTRELKSMDWLPLPTDISDMGYVELIDHPNGPAHFACWIVILQIAATCSPRGSLVRGADMPLDAAALARAARIPIATMEEAIARLLSPEVNWLEEVMENPAKTRAKTATSPRKSRDNPAVSRDMPPENRDVGAEKPRHITVQDSTEEKNTLSSASPPREPDVIWDTYIELFNNGNTTAIGNRGMFNKQVDDLKKLGATPDEMRRRLANLKATWPDTVHTGASLIRHWNGDACQDKLTPPPGAELDAEIERCLEINRKALRDIGAKEQP